MAKRLTDTKIWVEDWFDGLEIHEKLFWYWLKDNCDYAGCWRQNIRQFEKVIGKKFLLNLFLEKINSDKKRIIWLENGKLWIVDFIRFQQSETLNLASSIGKTISDILTNNNIPYKSYGYNMYGTGTVKWNINIKQEPMNTMPVENHRIIDLIKLSTKEHKDAYIEKEDKGIAVANPEPAGAAGKPPETAQGLAPAPATDPNAVAFVILNSYGRHEIKASFWKFSLALAKSDDWQAALLFYRARAARDPVAFIRAGFTKGYIWQSSIEEIQSPPSVKAWINATILRESLYPLRNILKGV